MRELWQRQQIADQSANHDEDQDGRCVGGEAQHFVAPAQSLLRGICLLAVHRPAATVRKGASFTATSPSFALSKHRHGNL